MGLPLEEVYSPTPEEVKLSRSSTRGEEQFLGFVLMLKSFQRLRYFPMLEELSEAKIAHLDA